MSEQIDKLNEELALYNDVFPLLEALEAARENKGNDYATFSALKDEWITKLQYWLSISAYLSAGGSAPLGTISVPSISASAEATALN